MDFSGGAEEELHKIYLWEVVKHPRCVSAFWFACAGCIPGLLIWWLLVKEAHDEKFVILWLTLVPTVVAALYGASLGAVILDPAEIMTTSRAFWRGGIVAFLSFLTLMALLSLSIAIASPVNFFAAFLFLSIAGFIYAGWEAFIIGGLAGWLLYRRYRCTKTIFS